MRSGICIALSLLITQSLFFFYSYSAIANAEEKQIVLDTSLLEQPLEEDLKLALLNTLSEKFIGDFVSEDNVYTYQILSEESIEKWVLFSVILKEAENGEGLHPVNYYSYILAYKYTKRILKFQIFPSSSLSIRQHIVQDCPERHQWH